MNDIRLGDDSYPPGSTAKKYRDIDGNEVTLYQLVRKEPEWAQSIISHYERKMEQLKAVYELSKQVCYPMVSKDSAGLVDKLQAAIKAVEQ